MKYKSRIEGAQSRMADRQATQNRLNAIAKKRAEEEAYLRHLQDGVQERERQMSMTQQAGATMAQAMHNETAHAQEADEAASFEAANALHNDYLKLSPRERYENLGSFVEKSRQQYELNPNEHTKRNFYGFAEQQIRTELSGYKPKFEDPKPAPKKESYIKFNGRYQKKVGDKWVDAPEDYQPENTGEDVGIRTQNSLGEWVTNVKDESGQFEPVSDYQVSSEPTSYPPEPPVSDINEAPGEDPFKTGTTYKNLTPEEKQTLESSEPGTPEFQSVHPELPQSNIRRFQALRNEFIDYPELLAPIEEKIEREMSRPQFWASQFDGYYTEFPDAAKRVIDKAKSGSIISPIEKEAVEQTMEAAIKGSFSQKSSSGSYRGPQPPTEFLTNWGTFDSATKARIKSAFPHIEWEQAGGSASPANPFPASSPDPAIAKASDYISSLR